MNKFICSHFCIPTSMIWTSPMILGLLLTVTKTWLVALKTQSLIEGSYMNGDPKVIQN